MTTIATLVVKIVGDISDLTESMNKSQSLAGKTVNGLSGIGGGIVLGALTAATAAATGLGVAAWNSAETIDQAYDLIATKTGATDNVLKGLQGSFDTVFKQVPTDAGIAADVIAALNTRVGLTGPALEATSVKLLNMTDLLGGDASNNAALFTRVLGDWSVPLDQSGTLLDKLFVASQKTGVGVDRLMQNVVQFGAPLRNMGFGLDESIALFAKWEKEGVNAELVMGSLRIAAGKFAKENIPLNEGLANTIDAIKNAKDDSEALSIAMGIFGSRAAGDMAAAIREGRFDIDDLTAALNSSDGAINRTTASTQDWNEKWIKFTNFLTVTLAPMGETLREIADKAIEMLEAFLSKPEVQQFIQDFADKLAWLADQAETWLPQVQKWFEGLWTWLQENQWVIVAVLAVIGAAIVAWAITTALAIAPLILEFMPVILVILLIAAVAAILYIAWTENWFGIQEKTKEVWAWLEPKLTELKAWLDTNIPIAIAKLNLKWMELQNQMAMVWKGLMLKLSELEVWLRTNLPAAIQTLTDKWNNNLLPALRVVWMFLNVYLFPLFIAVWKFWGAVFGLGIRTLAGLFQNVLIPALKSTIDPTGLLRKAFAFLVDFLDERGMPLLKDLSTFLSGELHDSWGGISGIILEVIDNIHKMTDFLNNIKLPDFLTPGSPTPFEWGLRGIGEALQNLSNKDLPAFSTQLRLQPMGALGLGVAEQGSNINAGLRSSHRGAGGHDGIGKIEIHVHYHDNAVVSSMNERVVAEKLGPAIILNLRKHGLL